MTKTICGTAALLTICCAIVFADQPLQNRPAQARHLDPRIGAAKPRMYQSIRDGQDWRNPYLVIRPEGVEVVTKGLPTGDTVAVGDLERTLIELPLSAWPYGRVVVLVISASKTPPTTDSELLRTGDGTRDFEGAKGYSRVVAELETRPSSK
jgi:hypothetical protein